MKIFDLTRKAIRHIAEAAEIVPKRNNKISLPDGLNFDAKLRPQLVEDVCEIKGFNFMDLKIGPRINGGRDAEVFDIQGHPDWVLRWEYDAVFSMRDMKMLENQDDVLGVVASNSDGTIKILKKLQGEPLYEKDWDIFRDPSPEKVFSQIAEIEKTPDEVFVKYYNDILDLRKNGYHVDTTNPNNILYDEKAKKFNIVDIRKDESVKPEITMKDFFPFLDGARALQLYRNLDDASRKVYSEKVCRFFDRINEIVKREGLELKAEEINSKRLQNVLTYIYNKDEEMLQVLK